MRVLCKCFCGAIHFVDVASADIDRFDATRIPCPDCEDNHHQ